MTGQRPHQAEAARPRPSRRSSARRSSPLGNDSFPVVGLGASAGGLDAFRRLLAALPAGTGMAFILIQHLDPTHASMMVDLLAGHAPMKLQQAADGMLLEREHVYLIPPGAYLSIRGGALRLSEPRERRGARLPFDFFLRSLAEELGARAICVILSGTGGDGSLGLKAVNEKGGLVIVHDPDEAEYDGMPRSAIMTGAVDLVLPVANIPDILAKSVGSWSSTVHGRVPHPTIPRIGWLRSSNFCARRPRTISHSTSRAHCYAGSSGVWRWPASMTVAGISTCCGGIRVSLISSPRTC
jgi:two-component system CheB/CheR fusion protein